MYRRQFLGTIAASIGALATGCGPRRRKAELTHYEFSWTIHRVSDTIDRIIVTDKVLNNTKTGYIVSTWFALNHSGSRIKHLLREDWLSAGSIKTIPSCSVYVDNVLSKTFTHYRIVHNKIYCLRSLDFEPC